MVRKVSLLIIAVSVVSLSKAQFLANDTLNLTLAQADSIFFSKNLLLLAQKYNVSQNEAYTLQAKIWDLPNLSIDHNLYNPVNKKILEISPTSETSVQLQQLLVIGGKRSKLVNLAQSNTQIAQYQYLDLLRDLKLQLRNSFYNTYFAEQKIRVFDTELSLLKNIVSGYELMYPKGFVSLREVVRLKALLFSLENDRLDLQKQLNDQQDTLHLLLNDRTPVYLKPFPDLQKTDSIKLDNFPLTALIDTALHNRPDLLAVQTQNQYARTDLFYQKALNIPNPTFIAGWDHNGSFIPNYNYVGLSFDLPFWNKNRGNIRAAEARLDISKVMSDSYELQVITQVRQSYTKALQMDRFYRSTESGFGRDFTNLIRGATNNFLNHELGLLEFVDLYESYKDSQSQLIQLQNDRVQAIENLNYVIGKQIKY